MTRLLTTCVVALVAGAGAFVQQQPRPAAPDALEQAYHSNNVGAAWLEQFEFARAADAFREAGPGPARPQEAESRPPQQ